MLPVMICEQYGWTYQEYLDAPISFIALIKERMRIDAKEAEKANKQSNRN